jgi:sugar transferase (PEP-CTERM system associated)
MLRISNHHISRITTALLFFEFISSIGAVYFGAMLRLLDNSDALNAISNNFFQTAFVFALCIITSMGAFGMYHINTRERLKDTVLRLMPSFGLAMLALSLIFFTIPSFYLGRGISSFAFIIAAFSILAIRVLVFKSSESGFLHSRIIFLGTGTLAQECHELAVTNEGHHDYDVIGFIPVGNAENSVRSKYILPANESIYQLALQHQADEIVVAVQDRRGGQLPIDDLLECKLNGIKVIDAAKFFEREANQIRVEWLQPGWLTFGGGFDQSFLRKFVKQAFDLIVSISVLICMLPIMVLIAICIYLEDRGPIFYFQEKIGLNGIKYVAIKFRSMEIDAENWASMSFPSTTRVGQLIRKLRLDELPQIFNVIKGEMSFVGPSPERPHYADHLSTEVPFYHMRHSIKPGITGLAQVRHSYNASVEDALKKLQYDLYYVKNNSLFLDMLILFESMQVVILGKDIR